MFAPAAAETGVDFQLLSLGSGHACGLALDNALWCWGLNSQGQLGRETEGNVDPVPAEEAFFSVTPAS